VSYDRYRKLFIVSSASPQASSPTEILPEDCDSPVAALFLELTRKRGQVTVQSSTTHDDWSRNAFLSMSKAASYLDSFGLSVSAAAALSSAPTDADHPILAVAWPLFLESLMQLFRKAQLTVSDWNTFYFVRTAFCTPGLYGKSKNFRFVNQDSRGDLTLRKYATRARIPLVVALRCHLQSELYPKIHISAGLGAALGRLSNYIQAKSDQLSPSDASLQEYIHSTLYNLFYEVGPRSGSAKGLFAAVVYSCLCVRWQPGNSRKKICRDVQTSVLASARQTPSPVACAVAEFGYYTSTL